MADLSNYSTADLMQLAGLPSADSPINVRQNNPGNMVAQGGGFQLFDTPQSGLDAMQRDLTAKVTGNSPAMKSKYGADYTPTLSNVISTWAPPTENNTNNYINFVSKNSGIDPNQPLTQQDVSKIMPWMIQMEGGKKASNYFGKPKQMADAGNIVSDAQTDVPAMSPDLAHMSTADLMKVAGMAPTSSTWSQRNDAISKAGFDQTDQSVKNLMNQDNLQNPDYSPLPDIMGIPGGLAQAFFAPVSAAIQPAVKYGAQTLSEKNTNWTPEKEQQANTVANDISNLGAATLPLMGKAPIADAIIPPPKQVEPPTIDMQEVPPTVKPLPDALTKTDSGKSLLVSKQGYTNAQNILKTALAEDGIDPADIAKNLEQAKQTGLPVTALDVATNNMGGVQVAGNGLQKLAKATANMPGQGMALAGDTAARGLTASSRIGDTFDGALSSSPYYKLQNDAIQAQDGSGPLYDQAYNANPNIRSPIIDKILGTDAGQKALQFAAGRMNTKMSLMGTPDAELADQMRLTNSYQPGGAASGLKLQTLDLVKQGLDAQIAEALRNGQYTGDLKALKNGLLNQLDTTDATATGGTGAYAKARQTYASGARVQDALEQGRAFMSLDPEEITSYMNDKSISDPEKQAFAAGARRALQDKIDTMRDTTNPISTIWKQGLRDRLRPIFPDDASFSAFANKMDLEARMQQTNNTLKTGSDTASNQQLADMIRQKSPIEKLLGVATNPHGAAIDLMSSQMQKATANMSKDTSAALMRYLTTQDPSVWADLSARLKNPTNGVFYKPIVK